MNDLLKYLADKLEEECKVIESDLALGKCAEFGDYKFACGRYRGLLTEKGWNVVGNYLGQSSGHRSRYKLWELVLGGDERLKAFRINIPNNLELLTSMNGTMTRNDKRGNFEKDKSSEIKRSVS